MLLAELQLLCLKSATLSVKQKRVPVTIRHGTLRISLCSCGLRLLEVALHLAEKDLFSLGMGHDLVSKRLDVGLHPPA